MCLLKLLCFLADEDITLSSHPLERDVKSAYSEFVRGMKRGKNPQKYDWNLGMSILRALLNIRQCEHYRTTIDHYLETGDVYEQILGLFCLMLILDNFQRPAIAHNMKIKEFDDMKDRIVDNEVIYVVMVEDHKTPNAHGHARAFIRNAQFLRAL